MVELPFRAAPTAVSRCSPHCGNRVNSVDTWVSRHPPRVWPAQWATLRRSPRSRVNSSTSRTHPHNVMLGCGRCDYISRSPAAEGGERSEQVPSTDLPSGDVERLPSEDEERLPVGGMRRDFRSEDEKRLRVGGIKTDNVPGPRPLGDDWVARAKATRAGAAADGKRQGRAEARIVRGLQSPSLPIPRTPLPLSGFAPRTTLKNQPSAISSTRR